MYPRVWRPTPGPGLWLGARSCAGPLCAAPIPPTRWPADDGCMETATLPEAHKTGGLIGAEIRGLDLTREYPDETYEAVRQAWAEHGVIFFRVSCAVEMEGLANLNARVVARRVSAAEELSAVT